MDRVVDTHPLGRPFDRGTFPRDRGKLDEAKLKELAEEMAAWAKHQRLVAETGYKYFPEKQARIDLAETADNLTKYVHDQKIADIIFIDKAARPGYYAFLETWRKKYPPEKHPKIFFANPSGFLSRRDLMSPGISGFLPKVLETLVVSEDKGEITHDEGRKLLEEASHAGDENERKKQFQNSYPRLVIDRDKPVLLFDTCIHTASAAEPILRTLKASGFSNVKLGIVNATHNLSKIKPDLVALKRKPEYPCHVFHSDMVVQKGFSPTSVRNANPKEIIIAHELRQEIAKVISEAK